MAKIQKNMKTILTAALAILVCSVVSGAILLIAGRMSLGQAFTAGLPVSVASLMAPYIMAWIKRLLKKLY